MKAYRENIEPRSNTIAKEITGNIKRGVQSARSRRREFVLYFISVILFGTLATLPNFLYNAKNSSKVWIISFFSITLSVWGVLGIIWISLVVITLLIWYFLFPDTLYELKCKRSIYFSEFFSKSPIIEAVIDQGELFKKLFSRLNTQYRVVNGKKIVYRKFKRSLIKIDIETTCFTTLRSTINVTLHFSVFIEDPHDDKTVEIIRKLEKDLEGIISYIAEETIEIVKNMKQTDNKKEV